MPLTVRLLRSSHLEQIDEAIHELLVLAERGAHPAPLPQQYLGTVVDNAACLLTAPANALDGGTRVATPSEDATWHSVMKAVHRAFLASLQAAVEGGLAQICDELQLQVQSGFRAKAVSLAARIRTKIEGSPVEAELRELERMGSKQPAFDDYLDPVLKVCIGNDDRRRIWKRFFRALSIVRNKASHFDTSLTEQERHEMAIGGLSAMVDATGELQLNPRMYTQLARFALDFFDEAYRGVRSRGSTT